MSRGGQDWGGTQTEPHVDVAARSNRRDSSAANEPGVDLTAYRGQVRTNVYFCLIQRGIENRIGGLSDCVLRDAERIQE
jgi:hypothetical protein